MAVILAMLFWAGAGIAVKEALLVFEPLTLIVFRFTLAVILMMTIGLLCRNNEVLGLQKVRKKDIPLFLIGGLIQPFLYYLFETYTYQSFASPTIAEAILSMQPILAPIFAWILLRERVTRANIIGILVSTLGMLILLLVGTSDFNIGSPMGVLFAFITVSLSVSYTVVLRKIPAYYSSLSIVFYVQAFALLLFYILWGVKGWISEEPLIVSEVFNNATMLLRSSLAVGYLAAFSSVAAFVLFCYAVRQIGVTNANLFNNVRPIFTAILMWMMFGEMLPVWKLVGILIIIVGLFISCIPRPNRNNYQ